jgi:hypothetical protein
MQDVFFIVNGNASIIGNGKLTKTLGVQATPGLFLYGHTIWSGGDISVLSADLENHGILEIRCDQDVVSLPNQLLGFSPTFRNFGTIIKTAAGAAATTVEIPFYNEGVFNLNGYTFSFISTASQLDPLGGGSSLTEFGGGTLITALPYTVSGGLFVGDGTIAGDLIDRQSLELGINISGLVVTGNFTEQVGAALTIDIAGIDSFSILRVQGTTTVSGSLAVDLLFGYTPGPGDAFNSRLRVD